MATILDNVGVSKGIKVYERELLNETHRSTIVNSLKAFTVDNTAHRDEDEEGAHLFFLYDRNIPLKVLKTALKNIELVYDEFRQKK